MTRSSATAISFVALLLASCATHESDPFSDLDMNYVSVEVTANADDRSFWDVPYRQKAVIDTAPADRRAGLVVGELGVDGGDRDMITRLAEEIAESRHGDFDSLLIVHQGKLVFESYYLRGRLNLTHPQVSATKSYTSLALGRAIQLGYLTMGDLHKPVVSFLDEMDTTEFIEGAEKITLDHALTMRSGIRISEEQQEELEKNPSRLRGQRQVQAYLERTAPITTESQSFMYQGADPNLVMQVIDAVVPGSANDFIKTELFDKLGIKTYSWQTDVSGLPRAGDRASITARAMVKFGTLVRNEGKWHGEQLIPKAFIANAIATSVPIDDDAVFGGGENVTDAGYGYFWWQADMLVGNMSYSSTSAQGGGGQFIIVIDALDLIVVATAHQGDVRTLQMTAERTLPAFVQ